MGILLFRKLWIYHCHWDCCPRDDWPAVFPEDETYAHDYMTLEMLINDWGTWEELFSEHIQTIPRWVQ